MRAYAVTLSIAASVIFCFGGCKESVTCGPGTHVDKGQGMPVVPVMVQSAATAPVNAPSAAVSASTVPSAAPPPISEADKAVQEMVALIAAAKDQFQKVHGERESITADKHEHYKIKLTMEGCAYPSLWKRPSGEWNFMCEIVPNKNGQTERRARELLHERLDTLLPGIPTDWKIERNRNAKPYLAQFRATDPTGHIVIEAHIVPRVDNSFDATFEVSWFPTPEKPAVPGAASASPSPSEAPKL